MSQVYALSCDCGAVKLQASGAPKVRGFCHCEDCRELLDVPYHAVTAWPGEQVEVVEGEDTLATYQHPEKAMRRMFCTRCGETLFNTNKLGWKIVSQLLIRKRCGGQIPEELKPLKHFYYGVRIIDIDDELPKRE